MVVVESQLTGWNEAHDLVGAMFLSILLGAREIRPEIRPNLSEVVPFAQVDVGGFGVVRERRGERGDPQQLQVIDLGLVRVDLLPGRFDEGDEDPLLADGVRGDQVEGPLATGLLLSLPLQDLSSVVSFHAGPTHNGLC